MNKNNLSAEMLLKRGVLSLSFMDNGLFISQEKSYEKSNVNLFYSYNIILSRVHLLFFLFFLSIQVVLYYHGLSMLSA